MHAFVHVHNNVVCYLHIRKAITFKLNMALIWFSAINIECNGRIIQTEISYYVTIMTLYAIYNFRVPWH